MDLIDRPSAARPNPALPPPTRHEAEAAVRVKIEAYDRSH